MNVLLQGLAEAVKRYPWQNKLLLVPHLRDGHQLLEALAQAGTPWVNLRPTTPLGLAAEYAQEELLRQGCTLTSDQQLLSVLENVLNDLQGQGLLRYFGPLQEKGILARVVFNSIMELRLAGVEPGQIDPTQFVDGVKGDEVRKILIGYIQALKNRNLVDAAQVYRLAADRLARCSTGLNSQPVFIPQHLVLPALARRFVEEVLKNGGEVLPAEPVLCISPNQFMLPGPQIAPQSELSYIFQPQLAPHVNKAQVAIFQAYGRSNEAAQVLRLIKSLRLPLDQVLITAVHSSNYLSLIYAQAHQAGFPVTLGSGIPVQYTAPGRLFQGMLQWIESGWRETSLYRLFISGGLKMSHPTEAGRLLRQAGIGWGRERCLPAINRLLEENLNSQARAEAEGHQSRLARLVRESQSIGEIQQFLQAVMYAIPAGDENNLISYPIVCQGLASIIEGWAVTDSEISSQAISALQQMLAQEGVNHLVEVPAEEAWQRLEQCMAGLRVGAASPRPGHLHVASLGHAEWIRKPYVFVLGMDAGALDQPSLQDPVLLDEERQRISTHLDLSRDEQGQGIYRLARFLAAQRGHVTLSFPCFDVLDSRACLPSALLLQVYRLISGDFQADYSTFFKSLPPPATYYPDQQAQILNETEWWLHQIRCRNDAMVDEERVLKLYPLLDSGLTAHLERQRGDITAYDGLLTIDGWLLDPRENPKLVMSASALESAAKCPFGYFLKYILGVKPPEELELEEDLWLDAKNRGSLLHAIYCRYLQAVCSGTHGTDKTILAQYALEEIENVAAAIPPPSTIIYQLEKQDLLQGLEIFHAMLEEQEQQGKSRPAFFEVPFGLGAEETAQAGMGKAEAIKIPLPSGEAFLLRGKIDRIDTDGQGHYQVWDYKTGSTYSYPERGYVMQGKQIQHVVYSVAAEILLSQVKGQAVEVDQAGYIFPTPKGEGQVRMRSRSRRCQGLQALEKVFDLMGQAVFNPTHEARSCGFCDYRPICRGSTASEKVKAVYKDSGNHVLDVWRELQQYE